MVQKKNTLTKTGIVALLACVCCILWGSAIPVIKTGYRLMEVDAADTASQIVFAGVRFTLAGLLVLIFASIREKKVLIPDRTILKYAVPVCLAQTVGQYFFFYIGVAHTSGVKGGIITGLGNFIAILMACLIVRNERMTGRKMAGCGIYISAGSACSSNRPAVSATLKAMNIDKDLLESTVRFSFSTLNTIEEIEYCGEQLNSLLPMLRKYVRR